MKLKYISVCLFSSALLLTSCANSDEEFMESNSTANEESDISDIEVSDELMDDLMQSITSPVEMANLIRTTGGEFNSTIMSETDNMDRFATSHDKAINMGVFVADLGYVNIYEKTIYAVEYLNSIKSLADDLMVGQFFDYETLKSLSANSQNIDSLLYISTNSFNEMDLFLRSQKRSELSILIITGAWLEGLYISSQLAKSGDNPDLNERIGEQKINLENIVNSIDAFSSKKYFSDLAGQIQKLSKIYEGVTISYIEGEPEMVEVDGQLMVVDNSQSIVEITSDQVQEIASVVSDLRNFIVKK